MITRRRVVAGSAGALLLAGVAGAAHSAPRAAADELIALPGKRPLIKRTFPTAELSKRRSQTCARSSRPTTRSSCAITSHRFRKSTRVRGGCGSAARASSARWSLSLDDLKRGFERVELAAVNQCSGNRRGLFTPRAGGVQWTYGAMGNAIWGGVRLRDVLNRAGVNADALEVVLDGADSRCCPARRTS